MKKNSSITRAAPLATIFKHNTKIQKEKKEKKLRKEKTKRKN